MTDVEQAWWKFLRFMNQTNVSSIKKSVIAGLPFVYITKDAPKSTIDGIIKTAITFSLKGKRLTSTTAFVRESETHYIYRIRFLVPQQKMFCCGHQCDNCVQFTVNH